MFAVQVPPGPHYEGRLVFAKNCSGCHQVNGERIGGMGGRGFRGGPPGGPPGGFRGGPPGGGPGMGPMAGRPGGPGGFGGGRRGGARGPDLGDTGAKHSKEWIVGHIRDPQHDKPDSRMRKFGEDQINDTDMAALMDYLTTLKGKESDKTDGKKADTDQPKTNPKPKPSESGENK
ncbi:MAG TPA: c-type cytochrome [Gemmataceae bacterium]|nr:c-type cytochrome [Gemmataceae bacterium]